MGLFGKKKKYNDDYDEDDYTTDWLEGAVLGAWTSVLICDLLDDEDDNED